MGKMMFDEFTNEVAGKIREFLPERFSDAAVDLKVVLKNNDHKLTGLTIKAVDSNIAPTIYLEKFFEEYENGKDLSRILEEIAGVRIASDVSDFNAEIITNFENCKDKIVPRLVSLKMNQSLLESRPHKVIEDLAVTYHVVLYGFKEGTGTVAVSNEILDKWGIDIEELHNTAVNNLKTFQKSTFQSMFDVLFESMGKGYLEENNGDMELAKEEFANMIPDDGTMFVLSNESKVHGASALLDKNMMAHIYEKFDGKFFIIPSSTHEVLIVSNRNETLSKECLASMIQDVNRSTVDIEDQLSDHAYVYDLETGLKSA